MSFLFLSFSYKSLPIQILNTIMLRRRKNKTVVRTETSASTKNNIASKSSVRQRKKEKRYDRRSPPTKRRTNRLHRSNNISAPVMETPIWLSPLKFSPYVSTTVQKLKRDIFESNVFSGQTAIPKSSTPTTLESLFAMSRSQRQRKAFRERFSSKKVNEHNITDMYSELLGEHLKLRQQLRSVLTPKCTTDFSFCGTAKNRSRLPHHRHRWRCHHHPHRLLLLPLQLNLSKV